MYCILCVLKGVKENHLKTSKTIYVMIFKISENILIIKTKFGLRMDT